MLGIPANTYNRLRTVLSRSDVFSNNRSLQTAFVDTRLASWHDSLPQFESGSVIQRVESTVCLLWQKYNANGENALILLLQALCDRVNTEDRLSRELGELVEELKSLQATNIILNIPNYPMQVYHTDEQKPVEISIAIFSIAINKNRIVLNMHWTILAIILLLTMLLVAFIR